MIHYLKIATVSFNGSQVDITPAVFTNETANKTTYSQVFEKTKYQINDKYSYTEYDDGSGSGNGVEKRGGLENEDGDVTEFTVDNGNRGEENEETNRVDVNVNNEEIDEIFIETEPK
jgi:hypothetical protein